MTRDVNQIERDQLEAIIDATSIKAVIEALSEICEAKADHITSNWQDDGLAKVWRTAAGALGVHSTKDIYGQLEYRS